MKIIVRGGPESNASAVPVLGNLSVEVVSVDRSGYQGSCAATMKQRTEGGVAYVDVTIPVSMDKCYSVKPRLVKASPGEVVYELDPVEDPGGFCHGCAKFTLKISYLPPGSYLLCLVPYKW